MKTALSYLDELKAAKNWPSDYRAAKELGISQPTMSHYRAGRSIPDADTCAKIAEGLEINPMEVIAAAEQERAAKMSNPEAVGRWRVRWERATAAAVGAAIALPALMSHNVCILCQILATLIWWPVDLGKTAYIRGTATTATADRETLATA